MLGNYLQQTTSADDIFRCIFFLGALRVNMPEGIHNILSHDVISGSDISNVPLVVDVY